MIDKRLYQETFPISVPPTKPNRRFSEMQRMKHRKRMPRVLRGAAIVAAMVMALAVTAGAVNVATDGEFFRQFTIVWTGEDSMRAVDAEGNEVYITTASEDGTVTRRMAD